ncbi:glycoside hydrolase family 65 protein [Clostridium sp. 19966]|uniref:family 65 glycosyl hydrolase domain-containing protein n=1 Tax=Clostridium sp. 19966 TaxID=2768166 RepID=UPI0028DD8FBC|nr:family 65 glycosyl hydrolase domain-containing protein [Clostridium sp. 19966]MDT8717077.1 glycoside hydrolase family 65 protein [Clostridium sp. 19966]
MVSYVKTDEWNVIQDSLNLENNLILESIMSVGNGYMGMRGNFEEDFSGTTLSGTYIAGVYYPDKTRVGWWKNGYPEYFAKVINSANFIGISVKVNDEIVDLAKCEIKDFKRTLNLQQGYLLREFTLLNKGNEFKFSVKRFLSMTFKEIAAISYSITPLKADAKLEFTPYIDGDVSNEDSNYDEKFWEEVSIDASVGKFHILQKTKRLDFHAAAACTYDLFQNGEQIDITPQVISEHKYAANRIVVQAKAKEATTLVKYVAVTNNRYYDADTLVEKAYGLVNLAHSKGFEELFIEHAEKWKHIWQEGDICISGDKKAQQAIRFNIFQLNCTYTGEDSRLNIGPKGFTGEKYGGSTYWDTEAYCLPFYLSTREPSISKNLLIYRYKHLEKAKENAKKLGLKGALYPMVTMNGEECHNEWEITFEELHRNAAITYAIFNYVRYTEDEQYLADYGFEVIAETARFWASRVNYNPRKDVYMMLGVTGPNEYENNVNNNWYTNTMAAWNIEYALSTLELLKEKYSSRCTELIEKLNLKQEELYKWQDIVNKMYYPKDDSLGIFLQQDGYLDKELVNVKDLAPENLPLNQKWSWDRILRSCFIKQADVLQGLFFLHDRFDTAVIKQNFDFYEPKTVHESSLSPCIHSILAGELGYYERAYELYLRTSRLDLDNYNNDTCDGLHITSMAGTWMSIVYGFGGLRICDNKLSLSPFIPKAWEEYSFNIVFRNRIIKVSVNRELITLNLEEGEPLEIKLYQKNILLKKDSTAISENINS